MLASETEIRAQALAPFTPSDDAPLSLPLTSTSALVLQGDAMERIFKLAEFMARGVATVPKHLQGQPADCLAVVMQATQWNMNPFAVAQKTHIVNGQLGYEAQLVNAVVQNSGAIKGEFDYEYRGEKGKFECRVGARRAGSPATVTWGEWLCEADVTTKNSPLWKTNPKQQLGYLQVKNWARLYTPGAILGVYSREELMDAEPMQGAGNVYAHSAAPAANESAHPKLAAAEAAAAKGVKAYAAFFESITKEERLQLAPGHLARKSRAEAADAARTVDAEEKKPAAGAAAAASTGGAPTVTLEGLKKRMQEARDAGDQGALDEAANLIGAVPGENEQTELEALYEALTGELAAA